MASIKEMCAKYYTEEGLKAIKNRIQVLVNFYNEDNFPVNVGIWGFSGLNIENRPECFSRVKELCNLIGEDCRFEQRYDGEVTVEELVYNGN